MTTPERAPNRNDALDGIRGIALLLVLFFHTTYIVSDVGVDHVVWVLSRSWGGAGVNIFFVLSGFLITGILRRARKRPNYFRNFYARRVLRIFPLYYAVVGACVLLPMVSHTVAELVPAPEQYGLMYWLYLSNLVPHGPHNPVLGVAWSLAIEEQFYLVWPLVVMLVSRWALQVTCWVSIVVVLLMRIGNALGWFEIPHTFTLLYVDQLMMGALVALATEDGALLPSSGLRFARWVGLGGLLALTAIWVRESGLWGPSMQQYGWTIVGAIAASMIVICVVGGARDFLPRVLSARWIRTIGTYSYAMYLFHSPLDAVVRRTIVDVRGGFPTLIGSQLPAQLAYWAAITVLTLAFSIGSWHLLEKHFVAMKSRFVD